MKSQSQKIRDPPKRRFLGYVPVEVDWIPLPMLLKQREDEMDVDIEEVAKILASMKYKNKKEK